MKKSLRLFLGMLLIISLAVFLTACGGGGGGGDGSGSTPPLPETSTQGDISQYSAGDIEDPNFNGIGTDEGVGISTSSTRRYDATNTSETCGPMGTGFGGYALNNCTEWVAVRRCKKGDTSVVWPGSGRHAKKWLDLARENGYETGTVPKPGAVAVFHLSYDPCPESASCKNKALYEYGHVAYVESVEKDINDIVTKWTISEYNYINKEALGYREFFSVIISDKQAPALIGFIYGLQTSSDADSDSPSMPTGLTGNAISSSRINLSWTASTDNIGVAGYKIYRNTYYLKSVPTYLTSNTGLSPSTEYCYTVSAYDATGNESSLSRQACVTTTPSSGSAEAFGTYLGEFNGVAAYSNGDTSYVCSWETDPSCKYNVNGKYTGIKWQCVEYVRRYYLSIYDLDLASKHLGDANTWYNNASTMGLESYPNGSSTAPQVGDILVSNGGKYGHLAIVKSVHNNYICTIQQNFRNNSNDTNKCLTLTVLNGNYTISGFSTKYPIKGLLRKPSLLSNTPPTATIASPSDGDSYIQGQSITFSGSGYDDEDGPLSSGSLVWTSSIDGQIGTGTSFTKSDLSVGTHTITLAATDSKGKSGNTSINIILTAATSLTITPTSPPSGTVGVSYPATNLSATGGKEPYRWSIISGRGSLPPDLSLSTGGVISGTPTTSGTYSFTVQVKDSSSPQQEAQKTLTIVVNPLGIPTVTSVNPGSGKQGETVGVTINGTNFTGATSVSFGAGVTVNSPTVNSSTQITANISISSTATTGARNVSVMTPAGTGTGNGLFTVVAATGGSLSVSPGDRFDSSGKEGGPFSPSSKTYTLSNTGGASINWTASKTHNWVSLSQTSGTLASGGSTTVTVTINSSANSLTPNNYVDIVAFTNTANGNGNTTRTVNLSVNNSTPTITVGPASLNFGDVQVGTCNTAVFAIQHVTGTGPASGTVSTSPPFSITSGSSFSVSNGSAANVTVQFCPSSTGNFSGTATVSSSATFTNTNIVTLTGNGLNPTPTTGTIQVNATLNGSIWSGTVNYMLTGPGTLNGTSVPANFSSQPAGTWRLTYSSGGPTGAVLSSISPSSSQTLSGGGSITFTLNFTSSTPVERITNGSFSSGTSGWTVWGDFWAGTDVPENSHTVPGYAAGGVDSNGYPKDNAYGYMYQTVTIPSNATSATLSFWYNITSQETGSSPYDVLNVTIQNSSGGYLATVAVFSNLNKDTLGVYSQKSFDMTPYQGQTIRVHFLSTTDSGFTTIFRIDDVSLMSDGS